MKLRELAYSRSGDKGEVSNICVFVYDPADYPTLAERLTAEVVQKHFGDLVRGPVTRYEIPTAPFVTHAPAGSGLSRCDERACAGTAVAAMPSIASTAVTAPIFLVLTGMMFPSVGGAVEWSCDRQLSRPSMSPRTPNARRYSASLERAADIGPA